MKKFAILSLISGLVACAEPAPEQKCMTPAEVGIVKDSKNWSEVRNGFRGGQYTLEGTNILVEVKGVVRVCHVDQQVAQLLVPGTKVSLINAERKF